MSRIERARSRLRACNLCERRCGVDRLNAEPAPCGLDDETWCFKRHLSFSEEMELIPSYMVYFAGCNFRCRFCVQAPACFVPKHGSRVDPLRTAADLERVVARGARTVNLLGGEPSLHPHTILEITAASKEPLPLVFNSNMYMTTEVLELLDGVVLVYLADFKFGNDRCARRLAGIDRYLEVVTRNLRLAAKRTRLLVRHLLMPGHLDCCTRPVTEWMAEHLPEIPFNLMTGYVPAYHSVGRGVLGRCVTDRERSNAQRLVAELDLPGGNEAMPSRSAGDGSDAWGRDLVVTIRIGPDGRLYWNDITIDLLPVALALSPHDPVLNRRAETARPLARMNSSDDGR
ncbi:MAG: radical SAM protein [Planctomycetota bacterium]